jgi:hypothetical protein
MLARKLANPSDHGFCSSAFAFIWMHLHMVTLTYPNEPTPQERDDYTQWFLLLGKTLPCDACKRNFAKNLEETKFNKRTDMASRDSFARFVWNFHNHINTKLGKHVNMSWEEFNTFYEELRADTCDVMSCARKVSPQCTIRFVPQGSVAPREVCCIAENCRTVCEKQRCLTPQVLKVSSSQSSPQ